MPTLNRNPNSMFTNLDNKANNFGSTIFNNDQSSIINNNNPQKNSLFGNLGEYK